MIKDRLEDVRARIDAAKGDKNREVTLIAVTKTHSPDMINEAIDCGVTDIGENKVQEILDKYDKVKPVRWHLIGHLQTNKVKYIIDKVSLIHSVDSIKLMDEIERQAKKHGITMEILIQVNITGEESKFGVSPDELEGLLKHTAELEHVKVVGLMTILAKLDTEVANRLHFNNIFNIFVDISSNKYDNVDMKYLSMGMSGDFETA
ncbi:MAG: YggS family pyridoxal phosphate-dependent enzyme, partial [Clostridia bacterium]|nr:YggS family pyridoxal phosphate-dependent enzyme [Clostridia bacterium]